MHTRSDRMVRGANPLKKIFLKLVKNINGENRAITYGPRILEKNFVHQN